MVAQTMKAAQFHPDLMTIKLETIPVPQPKHDEILVRTLSSGLCHSDVVGHLTGFPKQGAHLADAVR